MVFTLVGEALCAGDTLEIFGSYFTVALHHEIELAVTSSAAADA